MLHIPNHHLRWQAMLNDIVIVCKNTRCGQTITWYHPLRLLTIDLSHFGRYGLFSWSAREYCTQLVETLDDMTRNRSK